MQILERNTNEAILGSHVRVKNVFSKCAATPYVKCEMSIIALHYPTCCLTYTDVK